MFYIFGKEVEIGSLVVIYRLFGGFPERVRQFFSLVYVKKVEDRRQNFSPIFLQFFNFTQKMLRKFFRHFLNPPFQKSKRIIGVFVVEAPRLRVSAEPTHLEVGVEMERENSAKGGDLLIGKIIHLCIFGRVGAVLDELFADVD